MRARGLKHRTLAASIYVAEVAPHAGAWIETLKSASVPVPENVAPHAGAWIETFLP